MYRRPGCLLKLIGGLLEIRRHEAETLESSRQHMPNAIHGMRHYSLLSHKAAE